MSKLIYFVRHGQTDLNKLKIVQGRGVDSDLNEMGRWQAKRLYEHYQHEGFDKIYVSALKRTLQTVEHFIQQSGIVYESLSGLDEFDWGIHEGKQANYQSQESYLNLVKAWSEGRLHERSEGGESPMEVSIRQQHALDYIFAQTDEKRILICMHGRAMRLILCQLLNRPFHEMETFEHDNTSLYCLHRSADGKTELLMRNSLIHLVDK